MWANYLQTQTPERLNELGQAIMDFFSNSDRFAGGRTFGWDWPTMRIVAPKQVSFFKACQAEWHRRGL